MSQKRVAHGNRTFTVQFVSTSSPETSPIPCIHLFFDSKRYLFGSVGESCQRCVLSQQLRLARIEDVFFCQGYSLQNYNQEDNNELSLWDCYGGLPGFLLSLADIGEPKGDGKDSIGNSKLVLHGSRELPKLLSCMRHFTYHDVLDIQLDIFDDECPATFSDDNINVYPVVIQNPTLQVSPAKRRKREHAPKDDENSLVNEPNNVVHLGSAVPQSDAYNEGIDTHFSYVVQSHPSPGRFDAKKAKSLGITKGADCGKLARNENVQLPDGTIIKPSDVIGPDVPGLCFYFVYCPSLNWLEATLEHSAWSRAPKPVCIIHAVSQDVLNHPSYLSWLNSFGDNVSHLVSPLEPNHSVLFYKSSLTSLALNLLHPTIFPLGTSFLQTKLCKDGRFFKVVPRTTFTFGKTLKLNEPEAYPSIDSLLDTLKIENPDYVRLAGKARELVCQKTTSMIEPGHDIQLITLGTGSAMPSLYRNVSANLLRIPIFGETNKTYNILLDCGEGTLGRMARQFGDRLTEELAALRWIYISHMHADHHAGVNGILQAWAKVTEPDQVLFITAPQAFYNWLSEYATLDSLPMDRVVFINNTALRNDRPNITEACSREISHLFNSLGLNSLLTVPAIHCAYSFCVAFTLSNGCKIAYSGDTRPCLPFCNIGFNADLLIHEATLEDTMQDIAIKKQHCTHKEALDIAKQMQAKNVVLTHFSQRYPKLPDVHIESDSPNVALAFDGMAIRIHEISQFQHFVEPLKTLFSEKPIES
ncbi:3'-tRNA processing endonuclease Trz2 [Schizosaccharomyces japonicus yFS275]|uniref:ribonuclease Z n=1 Tax=Schizosaccharomyces japonicus (strain yFS275 / FY16936) TaxID=402676 RepID=B6JX69_SCHJY|nr:3'-tRNA processing endonuclease Trz2 [Schizosaccharomyces japonicus yFS275]EEB05970.1 3'-tRNA processing endonuclease Trz2 [Schizosaccharomyces japonicus yFS275]